MELWEEDLYELLAVDEAATPEEIRKAYKKLAIELHPDRFPDDVAKRDEATSRFGKITNAYNILKDEEERAEYDFARRLGFAGSNGQPQGPKSGANQSPASTAGAATGASAIEEDDAGVSDARRNQAENQFQLGKIAHKGKSWAKAIQHYKEAARLDPGIADYPASLGLAYLQQGLKTPANKAFEQAYKLDKKNKILKEHYTAPGAKEKVVAGSGGGGFFANLLAMFSGGKKDDKGKKGKGKGGKGKKAAGKR